jgi:hypothetical protein
LPTDFSDAAESIEVAFRQHTGISLAYFLVAGGAVQTHFDTHPGAILDHTEYFNSTGLYNDVWSLSASLRIRNAVRLRGLRDRK